MQSPRHSIPLIAAVALLALLAGCGETTGNDATAASGTATVALDESTPDPALSSGSITGIDAATGDARTMPGDYSGPTSFDLAQHAQRQAAAEPDTLEVAPPTSDAPAADPLVNAN